MVGAHHKKQYYRTAALGRLRITAEDISNLLGTFSHKGKWHVIIFRDIMKLIMLRKISQAQRDKHNMGLLMWDTEAFIY